MNERMSRRADEAGRAALMLVGAGIVLIALALALGGFP